MKSYYTRVEAAEILGCHPQTISNYAERGLFTTMSRDRVVYVEKQSFDAFLENGFEVVKAKEQAVEEYVKALEDKKTEIARAIEEQDARREMLAVNSATFRLFSKGGMMDELLEGIVHASCDDLLRDRERYAFARYLSGTPVEKITEELSLTRERVMQIIRRSITKVIKVVAGWKENEKEIARLLERCAVQHEAIEVLKTQVSSLEKKNGKHTSYSNRDPYIRMKDVKLKDTDLSVRVLNAANIIGAENVYELLHFSKTDFYKMRNVGKK